MQTSNAEAPAYPQCSAGARSPRKYSVSSTRDLWGTYDDEEVVDLQDQDLQEIDEDGAVDPEDQDLENAQLELFTD